MKKYEAPEVMIQMFEAEDVVTVSGMENTTPKG